MSFLLHKFRQKEVREKMKTQEGLFDFEEIIAGFTKRRKRFYVPDFDYEYGLHYKSQSSGATKKVKAIKEKRLSSLNFQKAKKYSYSHNFREEEEKKEAKYLLPEEYHQENEYWALSDENGKIKSPQEVFLEQVRNTKRKGGANPKFENSHWEAVINLNSHHTMEDLHKLRKHIESKYKFICCAMTIHRDEGVLLEIKGEKVPKYNYHAHLNFITYANGGQQFRLNKRQLSQIQSEVAEVLGMERGKEFSKAKRLAHQHYRYVMEQEDKLRREKELVLQQNTELQEKNQTLATKNQELEIELTNQSKRKAFWSKKRQEMIQEGGYTQQDYQFIRAIVMDSENDKDSILKAIKGYKELKATKERQGKAIVELQSENTKLKAQKPQIEVREIEKEVIKEVEKPLTQEQIEKIQSPLKEKLANKEEELALESKKHSEAMLEVNKEIETLKIENESLKNEFEDLKNKEPEVFSIVKEKEVVVMPSFEEIKKSLTYEQKQEIAEPFVKVYKGMQKNAEEQRDRYYEENRELIIERKTYYETRGWKDIDFNQELAKERTKSQRLEEKLKEAQNQQIQVKEVVKEVPRPLTEEQKQEIIAPYKEKITLLESIIQKFHNFLVKLGYKAKDSNAHEVPTLQEPKNENRMCPQVKAEMEKKAQKQGRGR